MSQFNFQFFMKHISFLLIAIAALTFSACKKNSTSPNDGSGGGGLGGAFSATVNGRPWNDVIDGAGHISGVPDFSGTNDTSEFDLQIAVQVPYGDTGVFEEGDSLVGMTFSTGYNKALGVDTTYFPIANSGSTHITAYTASKVAGTFNFTGKDTWGDSVVVTNGKINLSY
jgi:hypothetical protein